MKYLSAAAAFLMATNFLSIAHSEDGDLVAFRNSVKAQVVQIVVPILNHPGSASLGSGFWVSDSGLVATCLHVVKENLTGQIIVQSAIDALFDLPKGNNIAANWDATSARVVAVDEANDLAILAVARNPFKSAGAPAIVTNGVSLSAHFASAKLETELPAEGGTIVLSGYPLGQPYLIMQEGTVAALAIGIPGFGPTNKILISSLANHGNSGAPIYDMKRQVIGVLEGEDRAQGPDQERTGVSVAIPAYFISELMKKIPEPH